MAKQLTDQEEVHPKCVTEIENVSGERVTRFVGVLKLGDLFVATPDWHFLGIDVRRVVTSRNSEIDEAVFRGSLGTREVFCITATVLVQMCSHGVKRLRIEMSRIQHDISVHAIPAEKSEKEQDGSC